MKSTFITDKFTTLGGLGSVAYGDPEYFREVQNQIYYNSPTSFVDSQRPSDVFESLIQSKTDYTRNLLKVLEEEYAKNGEFTDYIDVQYGPSWKNRVVDLGFSLLQRQLDSQSSYEYNSRDYFSLSLSILFPNLDLKVLDDIIGKLISRLSATSNSSLDLQLALDTILNNPQTKISTPPPDSQILLEDDPGQDFDYRGVSISTGYSTVEDYWSNIPYPGFTDPNTIPSTLRESILNGYVGYLSNSPLEALFNSVGAGSISSLNLSSPEALNFSDPFSQGSILAQLPKELQGDKGIYSISLIGEKLNGYSTFDPLTMSNGDGIDKSLIPDFEGQNSDPDGGLPGLARTFSSPF